MFSSPQGSTYELLGWEDKQKMLVKVKFADKSCTQKPKVVNLNSIHCPTGPINVVVKLDEMARAKAEKAPKAKNKSHTTNAEELEEKHSAKVLATMAKDLGLDIKGNKKVLSEAIIEAQNK